MKAKKIVVIITTILMFLILFFNTTSMATLITDNFKPGELTEDDYSKAFEITGTIVNALTVVGTVIAVVGIMVIGIKYMIGSAEEKAEYKKTMVPYLVGCIFIFAITRIVSILYSLGSQI